MKGSQTLSILSRSPSLRRSDCPLYSTYFHTALSLRILRLTRARKWNIAAVALIQAAGSFHLQADYPLRRLRSLGPHKAVIAVVPLTRRCDCNPFNYKSPPPSWLIESEETGENCRKQTSKKIETDFPIRVQRAGKNQRRASHGICNDPAGKVSLE